ncbi:MAG TPA: bile acid:sodium symporter [Myxococcaceae bacterium]|nr:bile acid:sodium symporter [Myxococcaceae bacterium]
MQALLVPAAVMMLMVSIGMSLRPRGLLASWRSVPLTSWVWLLVFTFVLPPAVALILARALSLDPATRAGLFMVAATPGAPLLTRNIARRGFDMHLAASYQVWGALLTPLMIPLTVHFAARLYDREVWIPPRMLLGEIAEKQFAPMLLGLLAAALLPALAARLQPVLNALGNALLMLIFVLLLVKIGPGLLRVNPGIVPGVLVLGLVCLGSVLLLPGADERIRTTLGISNVNRHVGLALLLSERYLYHRDALPAVACYAVAAYLIMAVYAWSARRERKPVLRPGGGS